MSVIAPSVVVGPMASSVVVGVMGGGGGGPVPVMPAGAIGLWYASDYVAGTRAYFPNRVSSAPDNVSLCGAGRRLFSTNMWFLISVVISDASVADPLGAIEASTATCTGNWFLGGKDGTTLPAGTYTMAVNVKRNTGTDQVFAFTSNFGGTRSSTKTATSSWQRFSHTFTNGSEWPLYYAAMCSSDGSTGANLQIVDFELFEGTEDLGPTTSNGAMLMGPTAYSTQPNYANGELDLSGGGHCVIQMSSSHTVTECTAIALVSKVSAGTDFQSFLSKIQDFSVFSMMTEQYGEPYSYFGSGLNYNPAGLWRLRDNGYHMITHRGSASARSMWLDKIPAFSGGGIGSITFRDLWSGVMGNTGLSSGLKVQAIALYDRALTDQEISDAYDALAAEATVAPTTNIRLLISEGDSIAAAGGSFAFLYGATANPTVIGFSKASGGSLLSDVVSRESAVHAIIAAANSEQTVVVSALIGANDLTTYVGGAAAYLTALESYMDRCRAASTGATVKCVGCTPTPQNNATFNSRRATLRTGMLASSHFDAIIDFAGDPDIGQDSDALDTDKYPDQLHPSAATKVVMEAIARPVFNAL